MTWYEQLIEFKLTHAVLLIFEMLKQTYNNNIPICRSQSKEPL